MAVTIKDVAAQCGLSISTVSKAFYHYSDISEETRRMVQRVAREIGYYPNAIARTLKTNRSYNLGVLFVDDNNSGLTHNFFSAVLDAFKSEAERRGYDITFINHKIGHTEMTYLEHCHYRNVDGVCLACVNFYAREVREVMESDLPMVMIDHVFPNRTCILSENKEGMTELVRHAYALGHRKIAYIHGHPSMVTEARLAAYREAMAAYDLPIAPEWVREIGYSNPTQSRQVTTEVLKLPDPPTCLLLSDDVACLGALEAAEICGLRVPEDVSMAGYDGIRLTQMLRPRMTTIRQDTKRMGALAAMRLVDLVENPGEATEHLITVPGVLLEGHTMGPAPR